MPVARVFDERGFSMVELMVATGLLLILLSSVFNAMHPAHGAFRAESEMADVQQRLRVATDALTRALLTAGAGPSQGRDSGPLNGVLAPVLPFRQGRRNPDTPGRYKSDTITLVRVSPGAAQTTIAVPLAARSGQVQVNLDSGCPANDLLCGFKSGMDVLVFDGSGSYDAFTIASVQGFALNLQHNMKDSSKVYAPTVSRIVEATSRTYLLKADRSTDTYQLMQYDGAGGGDVPVVDHVVGLSFEYSGDPRPPEIRQPLTDLPGPWTTYGPTPPESGDNCIFVGNGSPTPTPRLPVLGDGGPGRVRLSSAELTDGPWCPDAAAPNRWDADLLRIRSVAVTVRVEAAMSSLRGPTGVLFSRGGTSSGGHGFVPDQEVRFEIAPRNLNLVR